VPIGEAPSVRAARRRIRANLGWWSVVVVGLVAVASVMTAVAARHDRDQVRGAMRLVVARENARRAELDSLRVAMADRDRLIANLTGPQVAVMSRLSADPRWPSARMFWDRPHDAWTFVAHHLATPQRGHVYQLWLVTPRSRISAGTFVPLVNGDAVVRTTNRLARGALSAVVVTEEPEGGSAQPSTAPFLTLTGLR
jgi:anti-sigma-K factor RskA